MSEHGVKSVDHGYNALLKRVFEFGHPEIATGILEADGAKQHETRVATGAMKDTHTAIHVSDESGARVATGRRAPHTAIKVFTEDAATIIGIADANEFGTDKIPARSFIRAWFDEAEPKMRQDLARLMKGVVKGTHTKEQILDLLGLKAVGGIQKRIADGIHAEPASGVDLEPGKTPLIKTGQLRSSISYAIREGSK